MNILENPPCPIWPDYRATRTQILPPGFEVVVLDSPRAGGDYRIALSADDMLNRESNPFDDRVRARLTTMLIDVQEQGEEWPLVTRPVINAANEAADLPVTERADRLLRFLGSTVKSDLDPISFSVTGVSEGMFAHSQSTTTDELAHLLKHLKDEDRIAFTSTGDESNNSFVITVKGHERIKRLTKGDRGPLGFQSR